MSSIEEIPEIDGVIPSKVTTKLAGGTLDRLGARVVHGGERVVLVVEARLDELKHPMDEDGETARAQRLALVDAYELVGTEGRDVLRQVRNRWQLADDSSKGVMSFDHSTPAAQFVMSDGTVLTPAEIAEARGEKWSPEDELLVVFRSGVRASWPIDWGAAGAHSLPGVGGFMQVPGQELGYCEQVVQLVDVFTDEVVAEWSDADEEARELAEAAREDRESAEAMPRPGDEVAADDEDGE